MKFIGRTQELAFLNDAYRSNKAEFILVSGRRRIGKTALLAEFAKDKQCLFFSCTQSGNREQLERFSRAVLSHGTPASRYLTRFDDWETAFEELSRLSGAGRKLIIIDEFPYLVEQNQEITSILQNVWDRVLQQENVMIILCGSAVSFMEKELTGYKSPLYGRFTGTVRLKPLGYRDAFRFFPDWNDEDKMLGYALLGGTPLYLSMFDPSRSLKENAIAAILRPGCALFDAPMTVLRQECREPARYNDILRAISLGTTTAAEIARMADIAPSNIRRYLDVLADLGYIAPEYEPGTKTKGTVNTQRALWYPGDNLINFWYSCVYPNLDLLSFADGAERVWNEAVEPRLHEIAAFPFESVCMDFAAEMSARGLLPFRATKFRRWNIPNIEIDIVAEDETAKSVIFGECKFRRSPATFSMFMALREKSMTRRCTERWYMMFSLSGFDASLACAAEHSESRLALVSLADLIRDDAENLRLFG